MGGTRATPVHRPRRIVLVAVLSCFVMLVVAGPADAHARLRSSDPRAGAVLTSAPDAVTLTFGESVAPADSAIRVYDDRFGRVDAGPVVAVRGTSGALKVALRPGLHQGTYVVVWQSSSADTHPVTGTFRFSIGAPSPVQGNPPDDSHNDTAGALLGPLRWLGYAGSVLCPGVLLMVVWLWPEGLSSRRIRRVLVVGAVALALSTVGSMLVQGVYASGRPLEAIWTAPDTLDTHSRTFDAVHSVRAFLLVALAALLVAALSFGPRGTRRLMGALRATAVVLTVVLVATWPPAGHAAATSWPLATLGLNLLHMLAMVVWLGGLVGLVVGSGEPAQREAIGRALPRFSTVALVSVSVLVVSGSFLAWAEVGSLAAVTSTEYGAVLLAKVGGVVVLVALGNIARLWVEHHRVALPRQHTSRTAARASATAGPTADEGADEGFMVPPQVVGSRRLRLGLVSETAVAGAVLALTAALVVIVPARSDYVEPWSGIISAGGSTVSVQVPEPRVGDTVALVTLAAPSGRQSIASVAGSISRPGFSPTPAPLPVGPDEDASSGATEVGLSFPDSGPWLVRLVVTPAEGDPTTISFTVPVVADVT